MALTNSRHHLFTLALDGKLYLAPVTDPKVRSPYSKYLVLLYFQWLTILVPYRRFLMLEPVQVSCQGYVYAEIYVVNELMVLLSIFAV